VRRLLAIGVLLALPAAAAAQRFGRGPFPSSGACFFENVGYRGDYFCVGVGRVPDGMNDRISSIRVFGRADVTVFRDARFVGGSARFDRSVRDLRGEGWNDRISSLRVQIAGRDRDGRGRDDRTEDRGNRDSRDQRDRRSDDADRIVRRAYQDVLGRDPDAAGLRQYRSRIIDDGWTEEQVRESLRSSPEYREKTTMTRAKAEDVVRRAYLAVLKREPDAGSAGYVNRVLRDKWSQEDVERELRKSSEFRRQGR
jgi:Peptidase inhibitor family I36